MMILFFLLFAAGNFSGRDTTVHHRLCPVQQKKKKLSIRSSSHLHATNKKTLIWRDKRQIPMRWCSPRLYRKYNISGYLSKASARRVWIILLVWLQKGTRKKKIFHSLCTDKRFPCSTDSWLRNDLYVGRTSRKQMATIEPSLCARVARQ